MASVDFGFPLTLTEGVVLLDDTVSLGVVELLDLVGVVLGRE